MKFYRLTKVIQIMSIRTGIMSVMAQVVHCKILKSGIHVIVYVNGVSINQDLIEGQNHQEWCEIRDLVRDWTIHNFESWWRVYEKSSLCLVWDGIHYMWPGLIVLRKCYIKWKTNWKPKENVGPTRTNWIPNEDKLEPTSVSPCPQSEWSKQC